MGVVLSIALQVAKLLKSYKVVRERIELSPGLPGANPSYPFWMDPPAPISIHHGQPFPDTADVVIIGSGITGTSAARTLMAQNPQLKVVMLEAREACSGATGRNGGHIKPPVYHDYPEMKKKYGREDAEKLMRFRLAHRKEVGIAAEEEGILKHSQYREVESFDVFYDTELYNDARTRLSAWKEDMPVEANGFYPVDGPDCAEKYHLAPTADGAVVCTAGAIHPYRFVTSILMRLLKEHPDYFHLSTHTPCIAISSSADGYTVTTPRGSIKTTHVLHATNAWASHLLPVMRTKIFPVRGTMSAQRPGMNMTPSTADGYRSWVFYHGHAGYDYLTQLPSGEREMMLGGGFAQTGQNGLEEVGNVDDGGFNKNIACHISGALPILFGEKNWGEEAEPISGPTRETRDWDDGRVKALWSGLLGISADTVPWVGRLGKKLAGRPEPSKGMSRGTAPSGEWIAAGYSGEGMAHAFLSGRAVALMIVGKQEEADEWLPESLQVSVKRWRKAKVENLLGEVWG